MKLVEREAVEEFRGKKGLPDDYVLYLGTLEPRKNVNVLVRAFGGLRRSGYRGELVLAGGRGWGYAAIEAAIEAEGLDGVVRFAGYVPRDEQPLWYNSAQVFVYPSAYEGFGLPVLEAMACGTPVITTTVSSLPEVAGDAGVLTTPGDSSELASALIELTQSPRAPRDVARRRPPARDQVFVGCGGRQMPAGLPARFQPVFEVETAEGRPGTAFAGNARRRSRPLANRDFTGRCGCDCWSFFPGALAPLRAPTGSGPYGISIHAA